MQIREWNAELLRKKPFEKCTENLEGFILTYYKCNVSTIIKGEVMIIYNDSIKKSYDNNYTETNVMH